MSLCSLHKDDSFLITTETLSFLNSNYYKWIQRLAGYMVGLKEEKSFKFYLIDF